METRGVEEFIRHIQDRADYLSQRTGFEVLVSAYTVKDGIKLQVINQQEKEIISSLDEIINTKNPDSIKLELHLNGKTEHHNYQLNFENTDPMIQPEFIINRPHQLPIINESQNFNGFGAVEQKNIESIVNKRLEEERKSIELVDLKTKLNERNESLDKQSKQIGDLESEIESKDEEISDLKQSIESKKNFKYYAGITGDILQSFGIKKEIIAKPLGGLLSGHSEDETKALNEKASNDANTDTSGIIEEQPSHTPSVTSKRDEMIDLLSMYIENLDTSTLEKLFDIFSEIENNKSNADKILQFLNPKGQ